MSATRSYRIGIHAPRGTGKTCLFTCLYGLRHLSQDEVTFEDEATLSYLRKVWDLMRKGEVPATAFMRPTEMSWRLRSGGDSWDIVSCDYAGALVEPSTDRQSRELRAEARAWFRSCDAILVLVDSSAPGVEHLDAVDLLLAELRKDGDAARPFGLVLTKWDTQGPPTRDPEEAAERLQQYFVAHPVFGRVQKLLREAAADPAHSFAVFPVSAFGTPAPRPGFAPPVESMRPYQLLAPWKWAALQARRGEDGRRRQKSRRRLARFAMLLLTACLAGVGTYFYADRRTEQEFLALRDLRQANDGDKNAEKREAQTDEFLTAWWSYASPSQREVVRAWRDADHERAEAHRAELARIERLRRHDEMFRRIGDEEPRLRGPGNEAKLHELYASFLDEFGDSPHASLLRPKLAAARDAWDRAAWDDLERFEQNRARSVQALVARARDYLRVPNGAHRADAQRMMARYEDQWDREEYGDLLRLAGAGTDARHLERVHARVVDYLDAPRGVKIMAPAVTAWRNWFSSLHDEGQYTIKVKSVTVPKRSKLDSFWGVDLRVTVELGDQVHRTEAFEGRAPVMNAELGPYTFKWGEPKRLVVRIENCFDLLANDSAEAVIEDERFVLARCHGEVTMTCRKGKTITVRIECPAAVPPPLPPYTAK